MVGPAIGSRFDERIGVEDEVTEVRTRSGAALDALQLAFIRPDGAKSATKIMGSKVTGSEASFYLADDECIISVLIWYSNQEIQAIQFINNKGKPSPLFGETHSYMYESFNAPRGQALRGFSGREIENRVTQLEPQFGPTKRPTGTAIVASNALGKALEGQAFSDLLSVGDPAISQIRAITIWTRSSDAASGGVIVQAIQTTFNQNVGSTKRRGGGVGDGESSTFVLDPDEYIVTIKGRAGSAIDQLQFITNKGNQSRVLGGPGGVPFEWSHNGQPLLCFEGRDRSDIGELRQLRAQFAERNI